MNVVVPPPLSEETDAALVERLVTELLERHEREPLSHAEFLGARFDAGLAWVHFPPGRGGLGVHESLQGVVSQRLGDANAPDPTFESPLAFGMAGPTVNMFGTEEQKDCYLRRMFTGEDRWCQLFSEPGAGSDLASLSTRAVRDGDAWIVSGQKVWSTLAHTSDYGLLLARTDPDQPKHRGITFFLLPMNTPGVDVRPLRQITGDAEFNEVFLDDVVLPDTQRVGEVNAGWRVATWTLGQERSVLGSGTSSIPSAEIVDHALDLWRARRAAGFDVDNDPRRDELISLWIRAQLLRLMRQRSEALTAAGKQGLSGSLTKLLRTKLTQETTPFLVTLLGADGMLYPGGYPTDRPAFVDRFESPQQYLLRSRSHSIGGGTSEVQRNIIGERLLGLPREPSADNAVPWSQTLRSSTRSH